MGSLNKEFQGVILPVITAFVVYNILGFFGNITVLYVYGFRYPRKQFRCLVLALSLVDLTSCCTTVPMETISTWFWFNAPSRELCKAKNFFVQLTGLSAMYMLFVTAVYKYRQICNPFGKQIKGNHIIILCFCGIFASLLCATPAALLWDINNHNITINNDTQSAMICEVHAKFHDTWYPASYRHLLSAYNVFLLVTIVLYSFVAKKTIQHFRQMKKRLLRQKEQDVTKTTDAIILPSNIAARDITESVAIDEKEGRLSAVHTLDSTGSNEETTRTTSPVPRTSATKYKKSVTQINIRKVLIMVIIAGTFSITFIMALTFGYVFAVRDYNDYSSINELILLFCCYRFYFINYAMNPVVYFSLDRQFRKEVLRLLFRKEKPYTI